jgi:hypothetical protein
MDLLFRLCHCFALPLCIIAPAIPPSWGRMESKHLNPSSEFCPLRVRLRQEAPHPVYLHGRGHAFHTCPVTRPSIRLHRLGISLHDLAQAFVLGPVFRLTSLRTVTDTFTPSCGGDKGGGAFYSTYGQTILYMYHISYGLLRRDSRRTPRTRIGTNESACSRTRGSLLRPTSVRDYDHEHTTTIRRG